MIKSLLHVIEFIIKLWVPNWLHTIRLLSHSSIVLLLLRSLSFRKIVSIFTKLVQIRVHRLLLYSCKCMGHLLFLGEPTGWYLPSNRRCIISCRLLIILWLPLWSTQLWLWFVWNSRRHRFIRNYLLRLRLRLWLWWLLTDCRTAPSDLGRLLRWKYLGLGLSLLSHTRWSSICPPHCTVSPMQECFRVFLSFELTLDLLL